MEQQARYESPRLADFLPSTPIARKKDPVTSHLAAEKVTGSGKRATQQAAVLEAVELMPGCTARELGDLIESDSIIGGAGIAHRRLSELEKANLVRKGVKRKCSCTDILAVTWWSCPVYYEGGGV